MALLMPNYYRSTARLMPPSDSGMNMMAMSALSRAGVPGLGLAAGGLLGMRSSGSLFIGILRARTVEDRVIDHFDLKKVYGKRRMEETRRELELNTDIAEDRLSGIITLSITDRDPKRAADMAKTYVDELNARLSEVNSSSAHKERVFIEEQLKGTKQELDQASQNFSQFASKNVAIDIQEQGKAMVEGAARLQGELIAAQSELKGLEQIYTSTNVRVRSLQARINELQSQLRKMGGSKTESAVAGADDSEMYPSIRKLPLLGVTYFDLYRKTKIQEAIYEFLSQQYEMAKVQEAKELPDARLLDAPMVPERKSGPVRTTIVLLGLVFSTALGMVWVLAKARWNDVDSEDRRKRLVLEIYSVGRARVARVTSSRVFNPVRTLVRKLKLVPQSDETGPSKAA
jgi:capsule polysaccharide export protein KpsE/RkpR